MAGALTESHLDWTEKFTGVSGLRNGANADHPAPDPETETGPVGLNGASLKRLIVLARRQPINAAFALAPDHHAVLILDRHRQPRTLERELRTGNPECRNSRFATVDVPPDEPTVARFRVNRAATGMARPIAKALRGTGFRKVRFVLEDGTLDEEGEEPEDEGADTDNPSMTHDDAERPPVDVAFRLAAPMPDPGEASLSPGADAAGVEIASADPSFVGDAPPGGPAGNAPGGGPRTSTKGGAGPDDNVEFKIFVPKDCPSNDKMFRLFEVAAFGREVNDHWENPGNYRIEDVRGRQVGFTVPRSVLERETRPEDVQAQKQSKADLAGLDPAQQGTIGREADRRFRELSGEKPGTTETSGEARMRDQALASVMHDRDLLTKLPQEIGDFLFGHGGPEAKPEDYKALLRIADKLKQFTPDDFALYKQLPLHPSNDLKTFEDSIDLFLAHRDEIRKGPTQPATQQGEPTMQDAVNEAWTGFDQVDIAHMSETDRYALAQQKADDVTWAQLKYMGKHPGETLEGFAKSATLANAPETLSAVGHDLSEAADGDANTWARFAGGAGAGAKLSGLALAAVGILGVLSFATGIGEAATLAAGATYLLGSMITFSVVERELRAKAASQATTKEDFQHNVNDMAAVQTNLALTAAAIVTSAALHFTAKALMPKAVENVRSWVSRVRAKIKAKAQIREIKAGIAQEAAARKAELLKATDAAKASSVATAKQIDAMSLEQFADWAEKNNSLMDSSSVPAAQKASLRELLKSDVGKKALGEYKQRLSESLSTHVPKRIDQLAQDHVASVDQFVAEIEKATKHEEIEAASDKLDQAASNEHANELLKTEQDKLGKQLAREAYRDSLAVEKGKLDAKGRTEADGVLQALDEGVISGRPRRPNLKGGEPDHDFVLEEPGKPPRYAEIKTPIEPRSPHDPTKILRPLDAQAKDIASKVSTGYQKASNVDIIINLGKLSPADRPVFLKALESHGLDLKSVKILNG